MEKGKMRQIGRSKWMENESLGCNGFTAAYSLTHSCVASRSFSMASMTDSPAVSYTHLTLPTILRV